MQDLFFLALGLGFSAWPQATSMPAIGFRRRHVIDYWLAGLMTTGLLVYLAYALLRPERF